MSDQLQDIMGEVAALIRLHRCPVCRRRDVLELPDTQAITENEAGELLQLIYCTGCLDMVWVKLNDLGQHFRFTDDAGGRVFVYSISVAEEIVAGREPNFELSPADMRYAIEVNGAAKDLDPAWVWSRDLSKPIILIPSPVPHPNPKVGAKCIIVIDGWHRMTKATIQGDPMPAHALTEEEAAQCLACITNLREAVPA